MGEKLFPWKFQPHSLSSALQDTLKNATVTLWEPRVYNPRKPTCLACGNDF